MKKYLGLALMLCPALLLTNEKAAKAQSDSIYAYTGTVQTFTVPCVAQITITAYGAQGGNSGGYGAEIKGTFSVKPGTVLGILVGGTGSIGDYGSNGGGGGGTFIWDESDSSLLMAAGGGGGYSTNGGYPAGDGSATATPTLGGGAGSDPGGTGGNGGGYGTGSNSYAVGGGGAGWYSNGGTNPNYYSEGVGQGGFFPFDPTSPGQGGAQGNYNGAPGGYGGGGGSSGGSGASGGGGGYNGGGGGNAWSGSQWGSGGGGGSYNGGFNQTNIGAVQSGNGSVTISWSGGTLAAAGKVLSNAMCSASNEGSAMAIIAGGIEPYTYTWAPSANSGDTATGLSAGSYTLSVTDGCGQMSTGVVTITAPPALKITSSYKPDAGNCDGTAKVKVSGGVPGYTYSWTGGGTTDSIIGKCAGTYCCTVTDAHGCSDSVCVNITSTMGVYNITNSSAITVYPEPNAGVFNISGLKNGQIVEIYNYMGQQLNSIVNNSGNIMHVDISNMANGIYLLKIQNHDGSVVTEKKIMKN